MWVPVCLRVCVNESPNKNHSADRNLYHCATLCGCVSVSLVHLYPAISVPLCMGRKQQGSYCWTTFSVTDKRTASSTVAVLPLPAPAVHIAVMLLFSVETVSVYIVCVSASL